MWITNFHLPKLGNLQRTKRPVKPFNFRYNSYGRARIELASQIKNQEDWDLLWKDPIFPYPFEWGASWKQCIEYKVDDFPTEVGFYSDVLGFPVNAIGQDYVQFTSPDDSFYLAIVPAVQGEAPTAPDSIRLQFNIANFDITVEELNRRGIGFEFPPGPCQDGSGQCVAAFRSPHGIRLELFGEAQG